MPPLPHTPSNDNTTAVQNDAVMDRRRWERPSTAPVLTTLQIGACLEQYIADAHLLSYAALPDGLANGSWTITWQQGNILQQTVLRVSARDHDAFLRESSLLSWLQGRAQAPTLIHYAPQTPLGYPWELLGWCEGKPLSDRLQHPFDRPTLATSIARNCISRLRLAKECPIALPTSSITQLPERLGTLLSAPHVEERVSLHQRNALLALMEQRAPGLKHYLHLEGIVHGDFGGSNLLMTTDGNGTELNALVDWEFASRGSLLSDLGNLLRHPVLDQTAFLAPLEEAFKNLGFPLPHNWREIALLSDSIGWLYFLSRPLYRPNLFADCYRRLNFIIDELAH